MKIICNFPAHKAIEAVVCRGTKLNPSSNPLMFSAVTRNEIGHPTEFAMIFADAQGGSEIMFQQPTDARGGEIDRIVSDIAHLIASVTPKATATAYSYNGAVIGSFVGDDCYIPLSPIEKCALLMVQDKQSVSSIYPAIDRIRDNEGLGGILRYQEELRKSVIAKAEAEQ